MIIYQFHNKMQYVHEDLFERLLDGIIIILLLFFSFFKTILLRTHCVVVPIRVISFDDEIQLFIYLYSILINCYQRM